MYADVKGGGENTGDCILHMKRQTRSFPYTLKTVLFKCFSQHNISNIAVAKQQYILACLRQQNFFKINNNVLL